MDGMSTDQTTIRHERTERGQDLWRVTTPDGVTVYTNETAARASIGLPSLDPAGDLARAIDNYRERRRQMDATEAEHRQLGEQAEAGDIDYGEYDEHGYDMGEQYQTLAEAAEAVLSLLGIIPDETEAEAATETGPGQDDSCDRCGTSAVRIWVGHYIDTGFDGLCGSCLDLIRRSLLAAEIATQGRPFTRPRDTRPDTRTEADEAPHSNTHPDGFEHEHTPCDPYDQVTPCTECEAVLTWVGPEFDDYATED